MVTNGLVHPSQLIFDLTFHTIRIPWSSGFNVDHPGPMVNISPYLVVDKNLH